MARYSTMLSRANNNNYYYQWGLGTSPTAHTEAESDYQTRDLSRYSPFDVLDAGNCRLF